MDDDPDDPNITITFSSDAQIHLSLQLPGRPVDLNVGHDAEESKKNLVKWFDEVVGKYVLPGTDVYDKDGEGKKVDGSYGGLRSGEWSKIVAFLTTRSMQQWQHQMDSATPPLTCGKLKVVDGISVRGNNTSSFPTLGPFL